MHSGNHHAIGVAADIPVNEAVAVLSFSPVVLRAGNRPVDLQLRVTLPAIGDPLPIILFSHGQGPSKYIASLEGYAPLVEFWAAHGFAVLQPTHLSSNFLGLKGPEGQELYWQDRTQDLVRILDHLDTIEATVPGLKGRLDRSRIAMAGHSAGAMTSAMLLGATNTDPRDGAVWHKPDPRISVGVLLAGVGNGGADLSETGKMLLPFFDIDFSTMKVPSLVVYGDEDDSPMLATSGAAWHADAYKHSSGPKSLLTLKGAKHGLGGISGWDAAETLDESPERLGVVQRMTWAYLTSQLYKGNPAWAEACKVFAGLNEQGTIESRR